MAISINDEEFEKEVLESEIPVLVDFWAEWCGPCRMLGPIVEELSRELKGKVKIVKINVDDSPKTPSLYGIRGIPSVLLFKDGKNIDSKVGLLPKETYINWIESKI